MYIYLMESKRDYDTVYKIGHSKSPNKRINCIQTGNDGDVKVLYTFFSKHGTSIENAMHKFYSHFHKNMEWFDLDLESVQNFLPMCEKIERNLDFLKP